MRRGDVRAGIATLMIGAIVCAGCWAGFRNGADRTGDNAGEHALGPGLATRLQRAWAVSTGGAVDSSPAVSSAGNVAVAAGDGALHVFDATTGTAKWSASVNAVSSSSPVWSPDGSSVYVGGGDGSIRALRGSDGAASWSTSVGGTPSSPALSGTRLYVGAGNGRIAALDSGNGALTWSVPTFGAVSASPTVGKYVYAGSTDTAIRALDPTNGSLQWARTTGGPIRSTAAYANGDVFVGSDDHAVYAFDGTSGAQLWKVMTGGAVDSSPAVDGSTVYVAGEDGQLRALDAMTGAARWTVPLGAAAYSSPAVADGVVYVGNSAGKLQAFNTVDGSPLWSDQTAGPVVSSPAEVNATVYVGSGDGHLYAYTYPRLCAPVVSRIACENSLPGTPQSQWDVNGGDPSIQGYATDMSVNAGQVVHFKVSTPASSYHADIYRLGFYGGNGARYVGTIQPSASLPQAQPACLRDGVTNLVDCGNWAESMSWSVPAAAVSGVYIARLQRDDAAGANMIVFVVRDDASHSDLLFQTSDTTWQAYNTYGGESLYVNDPNNGHRAYKVSYNRPFDNRSNISWNFLFGDSEYPTLRFLEANGYDVTYATAIDSDRFATHLTNHKVFLSVGHDEYWSRAQRDNVEAARAAGVSLAFLSGNESYWKTRWENSTDPSATPYRTLTTYKETLADAKIDPTSTWTGLWRDHRFSPPSDGGRPENALSGTSYGGDAENCCNSYPMTVSAEEGSLRLWRGTTLATLAPNTSATFGDRVVGYEWDEDFDNGYRPAGEIELSSTTPSSAPSNGAVIKSPSGSQPSPSDDALPLRRVGTGPNAPINNAVANPAAVHHVTLYRAASGALVFGAGTNQWGFGLDGGADEHPLPDARIRQATVNLLADMGVQPYTLDGGLVAASRSSDTTPPTSVITGPASGTTVAGGTAVTVAGTAQDAGGGRVGGVEVSVDGGQTWHPATGRRQWTYTFLTNTTLGPITIRSRATDDSANVESPGPGVAITVASPACPCALFGASTPGTDDSGSGLPIEVGMKFTADVGGSIRGVRFYKSAANTGTHVAHLWDTSGTLLATATFTAESGAGWQSVTFPTPVTITAGRVYVASYHTDTGHVADDKWFSMLAPEFFQPTGYDAAPLHMVSGAGPLGPNGVYANGSTSTYPTQPSLDENYWIDVDFTPS